VHWRPNPSLHAPGQSARIRAGILSKQICCSRSAAVSSPVQHPLSFTLHAKPHMESMGGCTPAAQLGCLRVLRLIGCRSVAACGGTHHQHRPSGTCSIQPPGQPSIQLGLPFFQLYNPADAHAGWGALGISVEKQQTGCNMPASTAQLPLHSSARPCLSSTGLGPDFSSRIEAGELAVQQSLPELVHLHQELVPPLQHITVGHGQM
jgi:hypothetical protein